MIHAATAPNCTITTGTPRSTDSARRPRTAARTRPLSTRCRCACTPRVAPANFTVRTYSNTDTSQHRHQRAAEVGASCRRCCCRPSRNRTTHHRRHGRGNHHGQEDRARDRGSPETSRNPRDEKATDGVVATVGVPQKSIGVEHSGHHLTLWRPGELVSAGLPLKHCYPNPQCTRAPLTSGCCASNRAPTLG